MQKPDTGLWFPHVLTHTRGFAYTRVNMHFCKNVTHTTLKRKKGKKKTSDKLSLSILLSPFKKMFLSMRSTKKVAGKVA